MLLTASTAASLASSLSFFSGRHSPYASLALGSPLRYDLENSTTGNFRVLLTSTKETEIVVTSLVGDTSSLVVSVTSSFSGRLWTSKPLASVPRITFVPAGDELLSEFIVKVSSSGRDNSVTIVASTNEDATAVHLLDSLLQLGLVSSATEKYYNWTLPANSAGVEITLVSLSGDADIFVNDCATGGFYHRINEFTNHADPFATWSSQNANNWDVISIPEVFAKRTCLCITVYGLTSSAYSLQAKTSDTVLTLTETMSVHSFVDEGAYQYYRFTDLDPSSQSLQFDVFPNSGDPDLFIGCSLRASGDDSGYPSRLPGHFNFSSTLYQEDALSIFSSDPRRCSGPDYTYYIAVFGSSPSDYVISAQHYGGTQMLVVGVPTQGRVYKYVVVLT